MALQEWQIQNHVVRELVKRGILHHGDQNAGKRGPKAQMIAKATGMQSGWPDLTIVLPNRILFVEFKKSNGKVSESQKRIHKELNALGFPVLVVFADTGEEAWAQIVCQM